jgi:hypothetical protein
MLGLVWDDVDLAAGVFHIRAQLSRAHRGAPARRGAPKTPASVRDVPLVPQLARLLSAKVDRRRAHSRLNAGAARSMTQRSGGERRVARSRRALRDTAGERLAELLLGLQPRP